MEGHFTTLAISILPNYMSNLSILKALSCYASIATC